MDIQIFYFTGTGNSLHMAQKIEEKIENVELIPLVSVWNQPKPYPVKTAIVGFVFPAYFYQMPEIVRDAVKNCVFLQDTYIFAVVTSGGDAGNTLYQLNQLLKTKNLKLNYGIEIPLGDNSIALHTPEEKLKQRFGNVDSQIEPLVQAIRQGQKQNNDFMIKKRIDASIQGKITYWGLAYYYQFQKQVIDPSHCTQCGLCKTVCPVNNIQDQDGRMLFEQHCVWCFACINFCPHQAIHFGKIHPLEENQYRASGIKAKEIAAQK